MAVAPGRSTRARTNLLVRSRLFRPTPRTRSGRSWNRDQPAWRCPSPSRTRSGRERRTPIRSFRRPISTRGGLLFEALSKCIDQRPVCEGCVHISMHAGCCPTGVESTLDHFLELVDLISGHIRNDILRASHARVRSVPGADPQAGGRRAGTPRLPWFGVRAAPANPAARARRPRARAARRGRHRLGLGRCGGAGDRSRPPDPRAGQGFDVARGPGAGRVDPRRGRRRDRDVGRLGSQHHGRGGLARRGGRVRRQGRWTTAWARCSPARSGPPG